MPWVAVVGSVLVAWTAVAWTVAALAVAVGTVAVPSAQIREVVPQILGLTATQSVVPPQTILADKRARQSKIIA